MRTTDFHRLARLEERYEAARAVGTQAARAEEAINRTVFALHAREIAAEIAAREPFDHDAYARDFERAARECDAAGVDMIEEMAHHFAEWMRAEEEEHGPWLTVPGHGRIRALDYARLRARVTGAAGCGRRD